MSWTHDLDVHVTLQDLMLVLNPDAERRGQRTNGGGNVAEREARQERARAPEQVDRRAEHLGVVEDGRVGLVKRERKQLEEAFWKVLHEAPGGELRVIGRFVVARVLDRQGDEAKTVKGRLARTARRGKLSAPWRACRPAETHMSTMSTSVKPAARSSTTTMLGFMPLETARLTVVSRSVPQVATCSADADVQRTGNRRNGSVRRSVKSRSVIEWAESMSASDEGTPAAAAAAEWLLTLTLSDAVAVLG